jgi:uncharacterized protein (DUF1330 family)
MAAERRRHALLYGLHVTDQALYAEYRAHMKPILKEFGGDFAYDFVVGEVLRSEVDHPINRVFTITFPDAGAAERFFGNERYLAVRAKYFEPGVARTTRLAVFDE